MQDITTRGDIELLLTRFYNKALQDPVIGPIFLEVAKIDLDNHLPKIVDFWSDILLNTREFKGNVFRVHESIHLLHPFNHTDFQIWLNLFKETLTENFEGPNTEKAQQRAMSIAMIMESKLQK